MKSHINLFIVQVIKPDLLRNGFELVQRYETLHDIPWKCLIFEYVKWASNEENQKFIWFQEMLNYQYILDSNFTVSATL